MDLRFSQPSSDAENQPLQASRPLVTFNFTELRTYALDPDAYGAALSASLFADSAIAAYARARQIAPALEGADRGVLNTLCRFGSITGHAADVLSACERAVALAPDDGAIRDSRGLARALTGDPSGAIADFQAFIAWVPQNDSGTLVAQRQAWIAALEAGRNPFDAQTLEQLKAQ